jgi:hypothetical protein
MWSADHHLKEPSTMRQVVKTLALFLLLGATLNVVTAWGCALWMPLDRHSRTYYWSDDFPRESLPISSLVPRSWPSTRCAPYNHAEGWCSSIDGVGVAVYTAEMYTDRPDFSGVDDVRGMTILKAGWPLPSMECHEADLLGVSATPLAPLREVRWHGGVRLPKWLFGLRREIPDYGYRTVPTDVLQIIPLRPMPLGFVVNSILFAIVANWFIRALVDLRAGFRRSRGRCRWCAYDVRGLPARSCPECGLPDS